MEKKTMVQFDTMSRIIIRVGEHTKTLTKSEALALLVQLAKVIEMVEEREAQ